MTTPQDFRTGEEVLSPALFAVIFPQHCQKKKESHSPPPELKGGSERRSDEIVEIAIMVRFFS
jgi:hypothetical protein